MLNFFKSAWGKLVAILANPIVYSLWHALLGGAAGYAEAISTGDVVHPTLKGLGGAVIGALIGWARKSTNPTEVQIANAVNTVLVNKGVIKTLLLGLLLFACGPLFANPIWTYGGGLNFGKKDITAPTAGFYSFPLIGATASPINFQNGEVYLAPQYGLSLIYLFGDGTMTPNADGSFSFQTSGILFGVHAGDGAFQTAPDGGTQVAKGFIGPALFAPSAFGNMGVGIGQRFNEDFHPFVSVLFVQSFDIGGIGPLKW